MSEPAGQRNDEFQRRRPFSNIDLEGARRYEAWYETPGGRETARAEENLLDQLLSYLPDASSVLEVGCGTGHFARWLGQRGLRVIGLDESLAMLQVARERGGEPQYVQGSAVCLPFCDRSFDLVVFVTSLEFMSEPVAVLHEAARVARHGLLLGVLNMGSPLGLWRKLQAFLGPSWYRQARFYTRSGLVRLVESALGSQSRRITWRVGLWPRWLPKPLQRTCGGAFIGLTVSLATDR